MELTLHFFCDLHCRPTRKWRHTVKGLKSHRVDAAKHTNRNTQKRTTNNYRKGEQVAGIGCHDSGVFERVLLGKAHHQTVDFLRLSRQTKVAFAEEVTVGNTKRGRLTVGVGSKRPFF